MDQYIRKGQPMKAAEAYVRKKYDMTLKDWLRAEERRGRPDTDVARECNVSRHTVHNWKSLLGIQTVARKKLPQRT